MKTKITSISDGKKTVLAGSTSDTALKSVGMQESVNLGHSLGSLLEITKVNNLASHSLSAFNNEYSATQVRLILQELFPSRKLVLSQLTFFNQIGVSVPTGAGFKRGRRLYRLRDLLPIAVVLALKEQGIPNKNVERAPSFIQEHADEIFKLGSPVQLSGIGDVVYLNLGRGENIERDLAVEALLAGPELNLDIVENRTQVGKTRLKENMKSNTAVKSSADFFWSYDVGYLAFELSRVCARLHAENKLDGNGKETGVVDDIFSAHSPKRAVA